MVLENALVYMPEGRFKAQPLCWQEGLFSAASNDGEVLDGCGCYAIPGLIDLHLHGCAGHDLCDGRPDSLMAIAQYEAQNGVTGICSATMSLPEKELDGILHAASSYAAHPAQDGARLLGFYLEGPFLSAAKKGAQREDALCAPDAALFRRLQRAAGGMIRFAAIAPELPGSMRFIEKLKDEVILTMAHTTANYEQACAAMTAGVHHVTHLYNAMSPFTHREPGAVGAAWDNPICHAELICDGIHVHPAAVRLALRLLGVERTIFVSDSMEATGMPDGDYTLGGQGVHVAKGHATLADGTIAGSAATLMDCLRTAVLQMGIPLEIAVRCSTVNPARELGIFEECGSLNAGKRADFVLLERDTLCIRTVFLGGQRIV